MRPLRPPCWEVLLLERPVHPVGAHAVSIPLIDTATLLPTTETTLRSLIDRLFGSAATVIWKLHGSARRSSVISGCDSASPAMLRSGIGGNLKAGGTSLIHWTSG